MEGQQIILQLISFLPYIHSHPASEVETSILPNQPPGSLLLPLAPCSIGQPSLSLTESFPRASISLVLCILKSLPSPCLWTTVAQSPSGLFKQISCKSCLYSPSLLLLSLSGLSDLAWLPSIPPKLHPADFSYLLTAQCIFLSLPSQTVLHHLAWSQIHYPCP